MAEFTGKLMPKRCCLGFELSTEIVDITDVGCALLLAGLHQEAFLQFWRSQI